MFDRVAARGVIFGLSLVAALSAGGNELSLSFPLGPYYRPGKYLPVHITASVDTPGNYWIGLAADNVSSQNAARDVSRGAGRTSVNLREGRLDATVPWFVLDQRGKRPRLLIEYTNDAVDGPELKRLAESERLVGWTSPDPAFARELLKGAPKIIPVALDPAEPIKGHAAAWEMLDAVILDADSAARLDQSQIAGLLAGGVTIAVKSDRPPFPGWPWRRVGEYSVLRYEPVGPAAAGFNEQAYSPVSNWQAGWSWAFRRRVLLIAALCCIPLLGLALWRPPLTALWAVLFVGVACFGIGKWWGVHVAIQQSAGEIVLVGADGLTQTDAWTYQTTSADRVATLRWSDVTRPVASDDVWISLNCDTTGRPSEFLARIPANRKIAFVSRTVGPLAPRSTPANPVTSPLALLADQVYLRQGGGRIAGELAGAPASGPAWGYVEVERWKALIIDRRNSPRPE